MKHILLLILIPIYAIFAEKTDTVLLEEMRIKYERQRSELPSYHLKIKKYDSTKDPFYKDKEVESNSYVTHSTYSRKKIPQVIIQEKDIYQLAPPNPSYSWHTEYYLDKNHLYYVNFRYHLKIPRTSEETQFTVTEIIVFLPKLSPSIAFKRIYSATRVEDLKPFHLDESFSKMDLNEKDVSGMTTAVLRDGILSITKEK